MADTARKHTHGFNSVSFTGGIFGVVVIENQSKHKL